MTPTQLRAYACVVRLGSVEASPPATLTHTPFLNDERGDRQGRGHRPSIDPGRAEVNADLRLC